MQHEEHNHTKNRHVSVSLLEENRKTAHISPLLVKTQHCSLIGRASWRCFALIGSTGCRVMRPQEQTLRNLIWRWPRNYQALYSRFLFDSKRRNLLVAAAKTWKCSLYSLEWRLTEDFNGWTNEIRQPKTLTTRSHTVFYCLEVKEILKGNRFDNRPTARLWLEIRKNRFKDQNTDSFWFFPQDLGRGGFFFLVPEFAS